MINKYGLEFRRINLFTNNEQISVLIYSEENFAFSRKTKFLYSIKLQKTIGNNKYFALQLKSLLKPFFSLGDSIRCNIDGLEFSMDSSIKLNELSLSEEIEINDFYLDYHIKHQFRYDIFEDAIDKFWNQDLQFRDYFDYVKENPSNIKFSSSRGGWGIRLTDSFVKSIKNLDKKLQGRILEALSKISSNPKSAIGNTLKPLTGDLNGLWRFRIGDYRLVYNTNEDDNIIELLSFESRGSVYK